MATDRQIFDLIRSSVGYKTTVGPIDKGKVQKAIEGKPSVKPRAVLAEAAWHLARRIAGPPPPPPPPPPPAKLVAPKVANLQGGSNARYCLVGQPGVRETTHPEFGRCMRDDVAFYDMNGLHLGGRSSETEFGQTPGLVGAREIDNRDLCSLPRVGDPATNTGSWAL